MCAICPPNIMTIILWILQILLALHTAMGALWKFSHSAQMVASLKALPQSVWLGMAACELTCSVALVLPLFIKSWGKLAAFGALAIAAEMLAFCGLHLRSGDSQHGHLAYWLIVAAFCAVISYSRLMLRPH